MCRPALLSFAVLLAVSLATAAEDKAPRVAPRPPGPVAQPAYFLKIQDKPRFPGQPQAKASEPASTKGLTITLQPERTSFPANGPLAFRVVLKNTSEQPLKLRNPDALGDAPRLVIVNLGTSAQWTVKRPEGKTPETTKTLKPGDSVEYTLVIEAIAAPVPVPVPVPRPVPLPRGIPEKREQDAAKKADNQRAPEAKDEKKNPADKAVPDDRIAPRRRPIIIAPPAAVLPCGTGKCRARLLVEFTADPEAPKKTAALWTGKLATGTVDFEVDKTPVFPPVRPPVPVPMTKEQAIQVAHPVAERALDAAYKSGNNPDAPPHQGAWIANPAKSAEVKELENNAGWRITWTHFAKGKGFSYNVRLDVSRRGAVSVREAFANYSAR